MKGWASLCAAVSVVLGGCASQRSGLVLEPVGPAPEPASNSQGAGTQVVFSAFARGPDLNRGPYHRQYSDYRLFSADGKDLLAWVQNDSGTQLEGPKRVELTPGRYEVLARANGYGLVKVPVVIQPARTTVVHLEGSVWWPRTAHIADSEPVRLPHSEIVGWRAPQ